MARTLHSTCYVMLSVSARSDQKRVTLEESEETALCCKLNLMGIKRFQLNINTVKTVRVLKK